MSIDIDVGVDNSSRLTLTIGRRHRRLFVVRTQHPDDRREMLDGLGLLLEDLFKSIPESLRLLPVEDPAGTDGNRADAARGPRSAKLRPRTLSVSWAAAVTIISSSVVDA